MEDFRIIYKILSYLKDSAKLDMLDLTPLKPEVLGISKAHLDCILGILYEEGYIRGVECKRFVHIKTPVITNLNGLRITLSGMSYLTENPLMIKTDNMAKGIM